MHFIKAHTLKLMLLRIEFDRLMNLSSSLTWLTENTGYSLEIDDSRETFDIVFFSNFSAHSSINCRQLSFNLKMNSDHSVVNKSAEEPR